MPELPDIELYRARLSERIVGQPLVRFSAFNPFVLRSFDPKPTDLADRKVLDVGRVGKRIVLEFEDEYFAIIHLMIAGRLKWIEGPPLDRRPQGKIYLAAFVFPQGTLILQESSTKKRAGIHLAKGRSAVTAHGRGGLNVLDVPFTPFHHVVTTAKRTLKRLLTDPQLLDGIGNAYSDEILFEARLSPIRTAGSLYEEESRRLYEACRSCLTSWTAKLQVEFPGFPQPAQITAFRPDFAVHGMYGKPCRVCGNPIQRIVFAENEANYCAQCQNGGKLIADRSLSRILKDDWPKTLEEMLGEG